MLAVPASADDRHCWSMLVRRTPGMMRLDFFTRRNLQHGPPRQDDEEAGGASLHQGMYDEVFSNFGGGLKTRRVSAPGTWIVSTVVCFVKGCCGRISGNSWETETSCGVRTDTTAWTRTPPPSLHLLLPVSPILRRYAGCSTVFCRTNIFQHEGRRS